MNKRKRHDPFGSCLFLYLPFDDVMRSGAFSRADEQRPYEFILLTHLLGFVPECRLSAGTRHDKITLVAARDAVMMKVKKFPLAFHSAA
ncbi:hypothetical protein CBW65_13715 [Tumebacillus avium]|uniref:Uncharacterized protein n=1 Tax=Tumebacillus avium TaxID=1903704 RepID=A0A1Y0IN79_9BACL|nr:hypothetical protein CBW65_13715 [Tumebacillus avium]